MCMASTHCQPPWSCRQKLSKKRKSVGLVVVVVASIDLVVQGNKTLPACVRVGSFASINLDPDPVVRNVNLRVERLRSIDNGLMNRELGRRRKKETGNSDVDSTLLTCPEILQSLFKEFRLTDSSPLSMKKSLMFPALITSAHSWTP